MEYRKFAEKAIEEIKAESPSYKNCEMLSWMYAVRKHCTEKLDRETAVEWVHGMENADGTTGPHWTMGETGAILAKLSDQVIQYSLMLGSGGAS